MLDDPAATAFLNAPSHGAMATDDRIVALSGGIFIVAFQITPRRF